MDYTERFAPPPLDQLVHCFWFLRGHFTPAEPQTVVADGRIEIILHLANPFARLNESGDARRQDVALISGQLTAPVTVAGDGEGDVVGIRLRTGSASALFRSPLSELTDRIEPLESVARPLARALVDAAARLTTPDERAEALSRVLAAHVVGMPDEPTASAIRQLDVSAPAPVHRVARTVSLTVRTLERRILAATGLPPAGLRRVMRFRRAFRLLDSTPRGGWTAVASHAGYTDQAHLIRDFRQFAGVPPTEFFRADPALARAIMTGND